MDVFYSIVAVYFSVSLLVAIRLAWHIFFRFDQYDRKYRNTGFSVAFSFVFWPLLLLKPKFLLDPSELLDDGSVQAEEARLRECPPPSGDRVRYRQGQGRYEESYGEFVFDSSDVEEVLQAKLFNDSHLYNDHEGAILNWLERHYDDSISEPTSVPEAWWRFQHLANELIREQATEAYCLKCKTHYSADQLILKNDRGRPGWNFDRVLCPKDHLLLITETMHIYTRPPDQKRENTMSVDEIRCRFDFVCPKQWDELQVTDNNEVRYCDHCNESVYLAQSESDLDRLAIDGKCAAFIAKQNLDLQRLDIPPMVGRVKSREE